MSNENYGKDFTKKEFIDACGIDYQAEYHRHIELIKELKEEIKRYREALLNMALKM